MTEIIVAIIGLAGVIAAQVLILKRTHNTSGIKQQAAMVALGTEIKNQYNAVLYRLDQLEKKQDKHNSLIERTYEIEKCVELCKADIKVANHRIDDLEAVK